MSDEKPTPLEEAVYRCPKCKSNEGIQLPALVETNVVAEYGDKPVLEDVSQDCFFTIPEDQDAECQVCYHSGLVRSFVDKQDQTR